MADCDQNHPHSERPLDIAGITVKWRSIGYFCGDKKMRFFIAWEFLDGSGQGVAIAHDIESNAGDGEMDCGYRLWEAGKRITHYAPTPIGDLWLPKRGSK